MQLCCANHKATNYSDNIILKIQDNHNRKCCFNLFFSTLRLCNGVSSSETVTSEDCSGTHTHTHTKRIWLGLLWTFISAFSAGVCQGFLASSLSIQWLRTPEGVQQSARAWDVVVRHLVLGVGWVWHCRMEDSTCTWYECMTMDSYRHAICTVILNHPQNYGTMSRPKVPWFFNFFFNILLRGELWCGSI